MTVCWADEEEKRDGKHKTKDALENVTGGILCIDKLEAHVGRGMSMCGRLIFPTLGVYLMEKIQYSFFMTLVIKSVYSLRVCFRSTPYLLYRKCSLKHDFCSNFFDLQVAMLKKNTELY